MEHESAKLLHASPPDPSLPLLDQLQAALEIYIGYAERHPGFRVAQRAASSDNDLYRIHDARVTAHRDRILTSLGAVMTVGRTDPDSGDRLARFCPAAILDWLEPRHYPQATTRLVRPRPLGRSGP